MNEFLIDCSFKQCCMALKFDLLIQRYAILIPCYALCRYSADHGPALCGIAQDLHTNSIQKTSRAMRHSAGSWSRAMRI
jgi:hypothetical protein